MKNNNQRSFSLSAAVALATAVVSSNAGAADWPNWRGPAKNGISSETGWTHQWPHSGPAVLWRASVGSGFSSVSVAGGRAYTTGNTGNRKDTDKSRQKDIVYCFDAASGQSLWTHAYRCPLDPKYYEGGTSATPTVHGGRVYTISKNGLVFCLDAASGKVMWRRDLVKEHGLGLPTWGFAGSVLVLNDLLILNAGTHGIALNREDGSLRWNTGKGKAGYSTPVEYQVAGKTCLAVFGENTLAGVAAQNGSLLWKIKWKAMHDENIADPVVLNDRMLVSSHLGKRCSYFELKPGGLTEIWQNRNMLCWMSSPVARGKHLYGMDARRKALQCMEIETGKIVWSEKGFGLGQLMLADGKLIVLSDAGRLVVADASPGGYRELAAARILTGKCWTVPVLANGRLYARNAAGDLVCLDVAPK